MTAELWFRLLVIWFGVSAVVSPVIAWWLSRRLGVR
jgi:hypothetical protein